MAVIPLQINGRGVANDGTLDLTADDVGAVDSTIVGQPSGVASLDESGKIPPGQIPAISIITVSTVDSQAAMLALDAQQGDMAIRTDDNGATFILSASPATELANWIPIKQELAAALMALSVITPAANMLPYFTGPTAAAVAPIVPAMLALLNLTPQANSFPFFGADGAAAMATISAGAVKFLGMTTVQEMLQALGLGTTDYPQFGGLALGKNIKFAPGSDGSVNISLGPDSGSAATGFITLGPDGTITTQSAGMVVGGNIAPKAGSSVSFGSSDNPFAGAYSASYNITTDQTKTAPAAGQATSRAFTDATYVPSSTGLGSTSSATLVTLATPQAWAAMPQGQMAFVNSNSVGLPVGDYCYFFKFSNTDVGGGWCGIAMTKSSSNMYFGSTGSSDQNATWTKIVANGSALTELQNLILSLDQTVAANAPGPGFAITKGYADATYIRGGGNSGDTKVRSFVLSGGKWPALVDYSNVYYNLLTQSQIQSVITGFSTDSALNPSAPGDIVIGPSKSGNIWIGTKNAYGLLPLTDTSSNLGSPGQRWYTVFASTGTINTSDAREKTTPLQFTDDEIAAAVDLAKNVQTYKWLASIKEKGDDAARTHIGMTVQQAMAILKKHGLDPFAYGFICYDKWDATDAVTENRVITPAVMNEDGTIKTPAVTKDIEIRPAIAAGDRYSFRMDELSLFIARGQQARMDAMQAQIDQLLAAKS